MKKIMFMIQIVVMCTLGLQAQTHTTASIENDLYVNYGPFVSGSTGDGKGNLVLFGDGSNGSGWQSSIKWSGLDGFSSSTGTGTRINAEITIDNVGSYGKADMVFKTKGTGDDGLPTEKMRILQNGNVGIGTTQPAVALEINKDVNGTTGAYLINPNTGSNSRTVILLGGDFTGGDYGYLAHYAGGYAPTWGNYSLPNSTLLTGNDLGGLNIIAGNAQGKLVFGTGSSERMRITSTGNVGVGTTAPDAKLTVKGKIHAEEVKVDLSVPAPDYVFKEDYDLRTLEETQQYIKEYGHLPNIPSAEEMERDGLKLGLMNMKLLEKIEELMLYTIHQEAKLVQQKKINQNLEARLLKLEQLITNYETKPTEE
ncbi:hypothetical protein WIW50_02055 [Flavobacteriaceae bacterium 3-367]|uniref:hypothetical protein n=1 Tax=Eudoraea algarum TaxID=3417568 RepID=UPI00328F3482